MSVNGSTTPVRKLRERKGLNQSDFWRPIGVSQSGGSRYEAGRRLPKPVQLLLVIKHGSRKQCERVLARLRQER